MHGLKSLKLLTAFGCFLGIETALGAPSANSPSVALNGGDRAADRAEIADRPIPCPSGWTVEPNPSADNSLSYMTVDGKLAVSVTSIKNDVASGNPADPESYARVAAEQMGCSIPVHSNLIDGGWTFKCNDFGVEGLVYGSKSELVLLGISGRSEDTDDKLNGFIRFLQYQAGSE